MDLGTKMKKGLIIIFYIAIIKIMFLVVVSFISSNDKYEQKKHTVKAKLHNIINKKP